MNVIRYNENVYIAKGFFERQTFMNLLSKGVIYKNYKFFIPVKLKEEIRENYGAVFTDNPIDSIFYGLQNDEASKKALIILKDLNGGYIYILEPGTVVGGLKNITLMPYFMMNYNQIKRFNVKLDKELYLEDYIRNTDLNIANEDLNKLIYSNNNYLYSYNIINRICLARLSKM